MIEEPAVGMEDGGITEESRASSDLNELAEAAEEPASDSTLEEQLDLTKRELSALEDRFLRQAADFQNFRKRAMEERAFSVEIGRSMVALPMVDVLDDLRRTVEAFEPAESSNTIQVTDSSPTDGETAAAGLREGVKLVYEKFASELVRLGVTEMGVVGQPFDENRHDAMMQQPAPDGVEPGTVLIEIQKGYMIGEKVLRHARVVVAS